MIALILAAVLGQTPAGRAAMPPLTAKTNADAGITRTIEKGDYSNVDDAKQVLIRTDAEWAKLWTQHAGERPRPAVDFSKEMIVGVFMGSRPNAGFSTTIVSTTVGNGALIVRYSEKMPAPRGVTAQVLTFPYHLVAIPKAAVTDVRFEKAEK